MNLQNIRIQVDKKYHNIYKDLTQSNNIREAVFDGHGRLFILCVCLGIKYDKDIKLVNGKNLFWSHSLNKHEQVIIYSISMAQKRSIDYGLLLKEDDNKEKIINISEKYANGGMNIFIENVLSPYVKKGDDGLYLDYNSSSYLEKDVLSFIQLEFKATPF